MRKIAVQVFLVIVISFFLLLFPACLRYANSCEADLFPTDLNLENLDQDDLMDVQLHDPDAYLLSAFFVLSSQETVFFEHASYRFSQPPSGQDTCILRC